MLACNFIVFFSLKERIGYENGFMKRSTFFLRTSAIIWLCLMPFRVGAQENTEFLYEFGGAVGGAFYMGDANKNAAFKNTNPAVELLFRRSVNFRVALKANLSWARLTGSTEGLQNVFPDNAQAAFDKNVIDLGGQAEFNFFPYSDDFKYLNTKRISPYIAGGLGLAFAPGDGDLFFSPYLSLGTGVKYKLKKRINIGAEWSFRKLFSDRLDVSGGNELLDNPYGIKSGILKNKDWYSMLLVTVTYDFGLRNCNCNNRDMKIK